MKRKRYTEEQSIAILKEHEAGASVPALSRRHGRGREHDIPLEVSIWRHGSVGS